MPIRKVAPFIRRRILLVCGGLSLLSSVGCLSAGDITQVPPPARKMMEATRPEILSKVRHNMSLLATLTASAHIKIRDESKLVPAGPFSGAGMGKGGKAFLRFPDANGVLFISRPGPTSRHIFFSGDMIGGTSFSLLGNNDDFWIRLPNTAADEYGHEPLGRVYEGNVKRESVRSTESFSIRPQDMLDLFLQDEVYRNDFVCGMETWDDYYVLTFIRSDWAELIYSKIWIERTGLNVALHQIFDSAGNLVAEARFYKHRACSVLNDSTAKCDVPVSLEFLWPRDRIVMDVTLEHVEINKEIDPKRWEPKIPEGFIEEKLQIPAAPATPG